MNTVNNILLTGATGLLGSRILFEILSCTKANIYCLSRDDNQDASKKRMAKLLRIFDPDNQLSLEFQSRTIPVLGDIVKPYLGLKPKTYKELAEKTDLVIHSAASVKLFSSYKYLKPINVDGTARITKFCLSGNTPLIYISTFAVLGSKVYEKDFVFYEKNPNLGQSFLFNDMDYEKTKFEAENIVIDAGAKGLKWIIIRAGDIFGDSETGAYPFGLTKVPGAFYDVFKMAIETGYAPFSEENFDISPVDYVAKGILHLSLTPDAYEKFFHLLNPVHKYFYEIINSIIEYGYRIRTLPTLELTKIFKENRMIRAGKAYSSIFTSIMAILPEAELYETARFDTSAALKLFENTAIKCPEADSKLISTYLDYCVKIGFLPPPEKQKPLAKILTKKR